MESNSIESYNTNTSNILTGLPMKNRTIFTMRFANIPLLRMHVQVVPLSLKEVLDIFRWTISDPFSKLYLPPADNTVPLLSLHWMVDGGLLLRFVPHTRVTGCPRATVTIDGPDVIVGGTEMYKHEIGLPE